MQESGSCSCSGPWQPAWQCAQHAMYGHFFKHYTKQGELCMELRKALGSFPLLGAHIPVVPIPGMPPPAEAGGDA